MLLNIIKPHYFIIAFAVGMLYVYLTTPRPEIVEKFPSPFNAGTIKYKEEDNNRCFVFNAKKTECPLDKTLIKQQPA